MARNSDSTWIKETLGKTSSNQTPLAAIVFSFVLGGVAFLSAEYDSLLYSEVWPLHALGISFAAKKGLHSRFTC